MAWNRKNDRKRRRENLRWSHVETPPLSICCLENSTLALISFTPLFVSLLLYQVSSPLIATDRQSKSHLAPTPSSIIDPIGLFLGITHSLYLFVFCFIKSLLIILFSFWMIYRWLSLGGYFKFWKLLLGVFSLVFIIY